MIYILFYWAIDSLIRQLFYSFGSLFACFLSEFPNFNLLKADFIMEQVIRTVSGWVWTPASVLAGLYFSIGTRFVQVRHFGEKARLLFSTDHSQKSGITSFQAFSMALSGRVGTGNIVGVATAIGYGGPGAIVRMWIIAFFGAGSAFSEATLAQIYKEEHNGHFRGGPAYYIRLALPLVGCGIRRLCGACSWRFHASGAVQQHIHLVRQHFQCQSLAFVGAVVALLIGLVAWW